MPRAKALGGVARAQHAAAPPTAHAACCDEHCAQVSRKKDEGLFGIAYHFVPNLEARYLDLPAS